MSLCLTEPSPEGTSAGYHPFPWGQGHLEGLSWGLTLIRRRGRRGTRATEASPCARDRDGLPSGSTSETLNFPGERRSVSTTSTVPLYLFLHGFLRDIFTMPPPLKVSQWRDDPPPLEVSQWRDDPPPVIFLSPDCPRRRSPRLFIWIVEEGVRGGR